MPGCQKCEHRPLQKSQASRKASGLTYETCVPSTLWYPPRNEQLSQRWDVCRLDDAMSTYSLENTPFNLQLLYGAAEDQCKVPAYHQDWDHDNMGEEEAKSGLEVPPASQGDVGFLRVGLGLDCSDEMFELETDYGIEHFDPSPSGYEEPMLLQQAYCSSTSLPQCSAARLVAWHEL